MPFSTFRFLLLTTLFLFSVFNHKLYAQRVFEVQAAKAEELLSEVKKQINQLEMQQTESDLLTLSTADGKHTVKGTVVYFETDGKKTTTPSVLNADAKLVLKTEEGKRTKPVSLSILSKDSVEALKNFVMRDASTKTADGKLKDALRKKVCDYLYRRIVFAAVVDLYQKQTTLQEFGMVAVLARESASRVTGAPTIAEERARNLAVAGTFKEYTSSQVAALLTLNPETKAAAERILDAETNSGIALTGLSGETHYGFELDGEYTDSYKSISTTLKPGDDIVLTGKTVLVPGDTVAAEIVMVKRVKKLDADNPETDADVTHVAAIFLGRLIKDPNKYGPEYLGDESWREVRDYYDISGWDEELKKRALLTQK